MSRQTLTSEENNVCFSAMKYLMICGSQAPTYCGIGKYTAKLVNLLQKNNTEVEYLTNYRQAEYNIYDEKLDVKTHKGSLMKFGLKTLFKIIINTKPDIVNIQYQTFGQNLFDGFFPLIIKLANFKTKIISTIHNFDELNLIEKTRVVFASIFSKKIIFADRRQLVGFNNFTRGFFKSKLETLFTGRPSDFNPEDFITPNFNQKTLHICFHGYIEPQKGFHYLLQALTKIRQKYKLHILSDFRPYIKHRNLGKILDYQKRWFNFIENTPELKQNTFIYGDIDPSNPKFKRILKKIELAIFPFTNFLTFRRSSLMNTLLNSNAIVISTFKKDESEDVLTSLGGINPSSYSIQKFIEKYSKMSLDQKRELSKKQINLKKYLTSEQLEKEVFEKIVV
jgi:glycosyltransferase involved in cell wall biosynthesis